MEQLYTEKRKQMSKLKATPTAQYAQQVASEILRPNPRPWFWLAKMSSVSWFLNQFFPRTLLDRIMSKQFGLNVFSTQIKQRNPHRLSNQQRVVLITGCSVGGIGHALAEEFHSRGARVFATARRLESMRALEELGITTFELDVTSIESIRKVHDQVSQLTGGRLDILINNAGRECIMAVSDMDIDIARRTFEINVHGAISMVQEFIQLLVASGDGCVVNSGSIAGILPLPFSAAYNSSKAAVHALSNTLRVELAPFNVKVVNLVAGEVSSSTSRPLLLPDNSIYKPIESTLLRKCGRISQATVLPTAHYAKRVVNELSKSKPKPWYWYGDKSLLCWIFDTFLWKTSLDGMLIKMFGISELAGLIQSKKAKND
ncbi:hypothetical protein FB446DRAFT_414477 [Lentinula raphanica]|nr:hypothetical protein FB446DRAFT_414477 [Lentinula raphanica]